jgi:membrane protein
MKVRSKSSYFLHKYLIIPVKILRIAIIDTIRQDGVEHAGYLSFLSILSLFPFLIFLIMIVGLFGASETGAKLVYDILNQAPREVSEALLPRIEEIISGPPQTFLTVAIIGVIWTASSSVEGCRTILNRAYRVAFPPPYIWRRLVSLLQFFVIVSVIILVVFSLIIVPNILQKIGDILPWPIRLDYDAFYLRQIVIFIVLTASTSLLYYILPNAKQKITQTVPGAILAVFLWFCLEKIFSFYLANFHQFNFVYGSLAGVIVSLMFFYLISLVFIVGAEFNYHFHRTYRK